MRLGDSTSLRLDSTCDRPAGLAAGISTPASADSPRSPAARKLNLAARQRVTAIMDSTFCDPLTSPSLAHGRAPHADALRGAGRGVSMHPTTQRRCHTNTARNAGSNQHSASEGDIAASIHDTSSVDSGSVGGSTLDYTSRDDVNGLHKDRGQRQPQSPQRFDSRGKGKTSGGSGNRSSVAAKTAVRRRSDTKQHDAA